MAWRTIYISNPGRLSTHNEHLKVHQDETNLVPLDDINSIVLNHRQITLSAPLLSALGRYNISLYSEDEKSIPNGVFHSFQPHSRQAKVVKTQIAWSLSFKRRMHQRIVVNKIKNQGVLLKKLNLPSEGLFKLIPSVSSGDERNIESTASARYFKLLFNDFTRRKECLQNSALNYGYTIVRGMVARALTGAGFISCLGFFHCNELNNFNLADDLMEPFRPMVDHVVYRLTGKGLIKDANLNSNLKKELVKIIHSKCLISGEQFTLHHGIENMVRSLSTASTGQNVKDYLEVSLV